jgi:hypothetical protein
MRTAGLAAWTVAFAIVAGGCSNGDRDTATSGSAGTAGAPPEASANANDPSTTTVTGCLQQGDGRGDFILTQVNSQPGPVATTGAKESTAVQEKQREAAANAYRLSGGPDNLSTWVGHQVRVTGKLEDRGQAQSREADREIKEGDVAKLEVTSAESVAETCGNRR